MEWDTRQTELRGRSRAADPAAPGTKTGQARGHTGRQDASIRPHPDTRPPAPVSCPRSGFKQKHINAFRQLIVRIWNSLSSFPSPPPQHHLFSPSLSPRVWGEGCSPASPGMCPGGPAPHGSQAPGAAFTPRRDGSTGRDASPVCERLDPGEGDAEPPAVRPFLSLLLLK